MSINVSSDYSSHVPADAVPRSHQAPDRSETPVALLTFATIVLILGALAIIAPRWLNLLSELGAAQSWYSLRLVALGGGVGALALLVLAFKLSRRLFARVARATN